MLTTRSPITPVDAPFLFSLYAQTRGEELKPVPWDEGQKLAFLQHQFQAQHEHYTSKYKDASFEIINLDASPIGRLYIAELPDEMRIIDITILEKFRGKNIGTTLIEEILHGADKKNKAVQIYLETNDRSANLFTRLGFAPVADEGIYQLWRRPANSRTNTAEV
jgi:N-acetylglutamate synthase-like GNAT family acetyltransferase